MPNPPTSSSDAETRDVSLDRLPVGVYRTAPDGRLLYANETLARILGYPHRDALLAGLARDSHLGAETHGGWIREMRKADFVRRREVEIRRRDGSRTWINHTAHPVRDEDGAIRWYEGVVEDAGEVHHLRVEAERKARILGLLETVATAANSTSDPDEIFQVALEEVCEVTGWPVGHVYWVDPEDPDGLIPTGVWRLERPGAFQRLVDVTAVTGLRRGIGLPGAVLAAGEPRFVADVTEDPGFVRARREPELEVTAALAFPVLVKDEVAAVLEFFTPDPHVPDPALLELMVRVGALVGQVVERARAAAEVRRLREELEDRVEERTADLEESVEELESFTYAVSHDLRTPLRALDGFSRALLEDYGKVLDETGRDYLGRVRAASQRMTDLIDHLLRLSRISRRALDVRTVDLSELAREVVEDLREAEPHRTVSVEIQEGLRAAGDSTLLRVVLQNLLGNAWKFTSRVDGAQIRVEGRLEQGEGIFEVRDNGAGFDTRFADKLFAPFQRLHPDDEFPGTGVGLATVQRIVRRHGGRIWSESAPGHGATFTVALPTEDTTG